MDEIKRLIESITVDVPKEEHLENIAILCQVRKEGQAEMAYAIERRLCPRCDAPIEEKHYAYHCPQMRLLFQVVKTMKPHSKNETVSVSALHIEGGFGVANI